MKAQLGSLNSRINANREKMNAKMNAWIEEMKDS
jgi:hypothetical protein